MSATFALIGFGEAGAAFSGGAVARAYDRKIDVAGTCAAKLEDFARTGVTASPDAAAALRGADAVLSLVTADQALAAARADAPLLDAGAYWLDLNSVAPDTKRAAAAAIEAAGGHYVDVAVMAPVHPARLGVPLLVSGPHAEKGAALLAEFGFTDVRIVEGAVGAASSIKMIRSVMVKGLEALTTECVAAAQAAGVLDEVLASLNASWPGTDWAAKADYNLERMIVHGRRRAEEMLESADTLRSLGISPLMTAGTIGWQQDIGTLALPTVPEGLAAKLGAIAAAPDRAAHDRKDQTA